MRNVRFGAMIDNDRELRMTRECFKQPRQLAWRHQCIEAQTQAGQRPQCDRNLWPCNPARIFEVLEHRTHALEQAIRRKLLDYRHRVGRGKIGPAHDTANEAPAVARDVE